MNVTITEHTTTDDIFCTILNEETGEEDDFLGTADEFIAEVAIPRGWTTQVIWS